MAVRAKPDCIPSVTRATREVNDMHITTVGVRYGKD
jgi:hypothetical protein